MNDVELKYKPIEEGNIALPFAMIKENLALPLPENLIRRKPIGNGGAQIDYVNVTDMEDLLDHRAGVWTIDEVVYVVDPGGMTCTVKLVIHASDGKFSMVGTGQEVFSTNAYGDPASNAFAQAFKRACKMLGLGRELWRKEENTSNSSQIVQRQPEHQVNRPMNSSQSQRPPSQTGQQQRPPAQQSNQNQGQGQGQGQAVDYITAKQLGMIRSVCINKNIDEQKVAMSKFNSNVEDLTKSQASEMIKFITEYNG